MEAALQRREGRLKREQEPGQAVNGRPEVAPGRLRSCQEVWKRDQAADRDFFDLIPLR
jgi:hypothetical protein